MLASVVEMTSIELFLSMWSSNDASSGTTCACIFAIFRGRREGNTGAEPKGSLSRAWAVVLRSVPVASGSASSCRERDTHTGAMIPRFNLDVTVSRLLS